MRNFFERFRPSKGATASKSPIDNDTLPAIEQPSAKIDEIPTESPDASKISNFQKDQTSKELESIINSSDQDKLIFFILKLGRDFYGIETKYERLSTFVSFQYENFSVDKSISDIYLDIIASNKDCQLVNNYPKKIKIGNLNIGIRESVDISKNTIKVEIGFEKSISEKDLKTLKEIVENYILKNLSKRKEEIDEDNIRKIARLEEKDILSINNNEMKVSLEVSDYSKPHPYNLANSILSFLPKNYNNNWGFNLTDNIVSFSFNLFKGRSVISGNMSYDEDNKRFNIVFDFSKGENLFNLAFMTDIFSQFVQSVKKLISPAEKSYFDRLRSMGVMVEETSSEGVSISELYTKYGFIGYSDIKDAIETNVILPWQTKDKYIEIGAKSFPHLGNDIITKSVLFEGGPGTGKTTFARIIGEYLNYPFIYIPVGSLMSKRYGEAESRLNSIFNTISEIAKSKGGAIVMIDEIDEIGSSRDSSHEVTGRLTGVLLKKLEGIEQVNDILLIGGTNRKNVLDDALMSRFKYSVPFRSPNENEIQEIILHYILGIEQDDISHEMCEHIKGMSGRDLKNICQDFARSFIKNHQISTTDIREFFLSNFLISIENYKLKKTAS